MKSDHVFQFKVTLRDVKPPIWRKIQVPCDYSFWDLHVAIQDAMGWLDCHLHQFKVPIPLMDKVIRVGIPVDDDFLGEEPLLPSWEIPIAGFFTLLNRKARYEYDFGDDWEHWVVLESIFPRPKQGHFPVCVGGRRACPPEDCGGPWGYERFLRVISDPAHEEREELLAWAGGSFDPDSFDKSAIQFDDPNERLERAFS